MVPTAGPAHTAAMVHTTAAVNTAAQVQTATMVNTAARVQAAAPVHMAVTMGHTVATFRTAAPVESVATVHTATPVDSYMPEIARLADHPLVTTPGQNSRMKYVEVSHHHGADPGPQAPLGLRGELDHDGGDVHRSDQSEVPRLALMDPTLLLLSLQKSVHHLADDQSDEDGGSSIACRKPPCSAIGTYK